MPDILSYISPTNLAMAIKANLHAFFHSFRNSSQATVHDTFLGYRWHTPIAHPWFNGVLCSQPPTSEAGQAVKDERAYFESQAVTSFSWWLAPSLHPATWSPYLLPHGFIYTDSTPGMAVDLAALGPVRPPLSIQRVEDQQMLSVWAKTFIQGYGLPDTMTPAFLALIEGLGTDLPFRHYLGLLNDQPVATASLFIGAGVAGIYNVATLAEVRGRGIGSAITLLPLLEARDLG